MHESESTAAGRCVRRGWAWRSAAATVVAATVALAGASSALAAKRHAHAAASGSTLSAALVKFEAKTTTYPIPTVKLEHVSKLKGKTIFYIPVANAAPEFVITAAQMKLATAAVGAHLQVCNDPTGTPTEWSGCVNQAIKDKVAAIVLDAAPWQVVANELDKAENLGIKVVLADEQPNSSFAKQGKSVFLLGADGTMQTAAADWVAANSGSKDVLLIEDTDGPSQIWYIKHFTLPVFSKQGVKYTLQKISSANQGTLPSDVSSDLLKNSDVNYVYTQYDQFLPQTQQGVQSASDMSKVEGVSTSATLAGLEMIKSKTLQYADAGIDFPYSAWAFLDDTYRLILGQPVVTESVPLRMFTRQNIDTVTLSNAAQDDGSWYGPLTFAASFEKLWGVK